MTRKTKWIILISLPIIGILAGYLLMARQVSITVDGQTSEVTTRALTVRGALRSAGYTLDPLDEVSPSPSSWLSRTTTIDLQRSHPLQVWNDGTGLLTVVDTSAKTPAEMLAAAGILYKEGDRVRVNGMNVTLDTELSPDGRFVLQYTPALVFTVNQNGNSTTFNSTATTLGMALWEQQIRLYGGDALSQPFNRAIDPDQPVTINNAIPLIITVDNKDIPVFVSAQTVGEALAMAGVSLQDLDFSKPAENEPLPVDGRIFVTRVREEILQEQQTIPFSTETTTDASLPLDQEKVVQTGEVGLQAVRVKVRYEDGVEVSRTALESVVVKSPVNQIVAYGASVNVQTTSIASCGTITYYRAMDVTATSYSPCNSGSDQCYPNAASGVPVQRGVLAVHLDWYRLLKGSKICVPGYGIGSVEDTGSYPNNHNWIDLGYTDAEYDSAPLKFAQSITIYFLMPYPSGGPPVLP